MLLREYLNGYTKEQLLDYARLLELKRYSRLRKAELIDLISECFCEEGRLRNILTCLTKEQMDIFRKACGEAQDIFTNETVDVIQLCKYWLGAFDEPTGKFHVFEEVSDVFKKIDDETFALEQSKKGWIVKCTQFFVDYYGAAPIEVFYKLYRLKANDTMDEMIELLNDMPADILDASLVSMEDVSLKDVPETSPIYSSNGLFVHMPLLENGNLDALLKVQKETDFYIPSAKQLEEICGVGYEASSFAYKNLVAFFTDKMDMSDEEAITWCLKIWLSIYEGKAPSDIVNQMSKENVAFNGEIQLKELIQLLMDAHNSTRTKQNRGHAPSELKKKASAAPAKPSVTPSAIPKNAPLNAFVNRVPSTPKKPEPVAKKKIYPNDPCPCGSGKKYKKCCGRK